MREVLPLRILRYRRLNGLSQRELGIEARIHRATLSILEGGQAPDMLVSTLARLSESLAITPDALLGYDALDLVRAPVGISTATVREWMVGYECGICGAGVSPRGLHVLSDCVAELAFRGRTASQIDALLGLDRLAVEFMLRTAA
jgi:transcriptional regulator with XRE-family HTH domain